MATMKPTMKPLTLTYLDHTVSASVKCLICLEVVSPEAVQVSCSVNQLMCAECIAHWIGSLLVSKKPTTCPHCRSRIDASNLRAAHATNDWKDDQDGFFEDSEEEGDYDFDDGDYGSDNGYDEENHGENNGWGQGSDAGENTGEDRECLDEYEQDNDAKGEVDGDDHRIAVQNEFEATEADDDGRQPTDDDQHGRWGNEAWGNDREDDEETEVSFQGSDDGMFQEDGGHELPVLEIEPEVDVDEATSEEKMAVVNRDSMQGGQGDAQHNEW